MLEFIIAESIKLFRDNVSVGSWFSQFKQASIDFVTESRIAWVEIEGVPFKLWSSNTFKRRSILEEFKIIHRGKVYWIRANETPGWVPDFADESDDEDQDDVKSKDGGFNDHEPGCGGSDTDVEEVPETLFEVDIQSEGSLKYPPGFTPQEGTGANSMHAEGDINDNVVDFSVCKMDGANDVSSGNRFKVNSKDDSVESAPSGHFKKSVIPRTGGSILGILDEVVKVGQVMGYKMDGCMSNMAEIIESQGVEE
ncbi:hypothetical protein Tco_1136692, partial [Tanacetum coccineum]